LPYAVNSPQKEKFVKSDWPTCTNFASEKNFEVENFQLLTMIFSENFLSAENFLEWKLMGLDAKLKLSIFARVYTAKNDNFSLPRNLGSKASQGGHARKICLCVYDLQGNLDKCIQEILLWFWQTKGDLT
jgi:hypothetical protein